MRFDSNCSNAAMGAISSLDRVVRVVSPFTEARKHSRLQKYCNRVENFIVHVGIVSNSDLDAEDVANAMSE